MHVYNFSIKYPDGRFIESPGYMFLALKVSHAKIMAYHELYVGGDVSELFGCNSDEDYTFDTVARLLIGRYHGLLSGNMVNIDSENNNFKIEINTNHFYIAEAYLGLLMFGVFQLSRLRRGENITVNRQDKSIVCYRPNAWYNQSNLQFRLYSEL